MSKHEIEFSKILDSQGRKWELCPRFKLSKSTYRPDFYLPEEDLYIELSYDVRNFLHNKEKYEEFKTLYSEKKFIVVDMNFVPYPRPSRPQYPGFQCFSCGYEWTGRKENPRVCPKCKSYNWNKSREVNRSSAHEETNKTSTN